jgi:hypothetical protein
MRCQPPDRGIDDRKAPLGSSAGDQVGRSRFDGAHIDNDLLRPGVCQNAVGAKHREFDLG